MTPAAVHFSPWLSLPIAAVLAAVLVWYWMQLGSRDVPRSRRWIRRFSLAMSFALLATAVAGVSFIDPTAQQAVYVATWSTVILLILVVMLTAVADIFNSVRLQREMRRQMEIDAAADLHRAIRETTASAQTPRVNTPTTNGSRGTRSNGSFE